MLLYQNEGFRSGTSSHRGEVAVVIVVVSFLRLFWFLSPGANKRRGDSLSFTKMKDRGHSQGLCFFFNPHQFFAPAFVDIGDVELQSRIFPPPFLLYCTIAVSC